MKARDREAVIVAAVRTPIGKRGGQLSELHPVDLLVEVVRDVVATSGVQPELIDDVIAGCVSQVGHQSCNVARSAALGAGLPESVPGTTVDRQCGSSQQAVHFAAQGVLANAYDFVVVGGVESMSMVPMYSNFADDSEPFGSALRRRLGIGEADFLHQGWGAEQLCRNWGLSREDLDEFALSSHAKALQAVEAGSFANEVLAIKDESGTLISTDQGPRASSLEALAALPPVFEPTGRITAGNASQISDGAAALLIADRGAAERANMPILARVREMTVVGSDPRLMLTGPIAATRKVLQRAELSLDDIDLFEINEAFASVPLAWAKELKVGHERLNVRGGAIALGHPLGATGARIICTLVHALRDLDLRRGLVSICEGGGMANATILEAVR